MFKLQLQLLLFLLFFSIAKCEEVTFKNVTVLGYNMDVQKFKVNIKSANGLKNELPKQQFTKLEIIDQNVPALTKNSVKDIEDLTELVMENDGITRIEPGCFENLPNLAKISLKANKIELISKGVFNHLKISTLDLSHNSIRDIESTAFDYLPKLITLDLENNKINNWNKEWFYKSPMLSRVDLRNNSIESLPTNAFQNLKGERYFGSVKLRRSLYFSYNKINHIDLKTFNGIDAIDVLWLDHNLLESFTETYLKDVEVEELRIDGNKISCLTGDLSKVLKPSLVTIDANPFDCDCLAAIKKWKEVNNKKISVFYSDMNCYADRIKSKMLDLEEKLKEMKRNRLEANTEKSD